MSWWTDLRDTVEYVGTAGMYDPWKSRENDRKSRENDRQQRDMVNAQIKAYQDQTNLAKQQLDEARNATQAEKRRVEEKQIRALRRNYRAAGMLGTGAAASEDMNQKLGG
jgi:hypothetical protein